MRIREWGTPPLQPVTFTIEEAHERFHVLFDKRDSKVYIKRGAGDTEKLTAADLGSSARVVEVVDLLFTHGTPLSSSKLAKTAWIREKKGFNRIAAALSKAVRARTGVDLGLRADKADPAFQIVFAPPSALRVGMIVTDDVV